MSEESPKPNGNPNGRPALPMAAQGEIFGRLSVCERGSQEFRTTRLEMASKFARTERAIEQIYERRCDDFLNKNGRERLTATRP